MKLLEAIEEIKKGKDMHRAAWSKDDGYLKYMQGMDHIWKIQLKPNPNAGNYIFSLADLEGDDWQEFDVNQDVLVVKE